MKKYSGFSLITLITILSMVILENADSQDIAYAKSITSMLCSSRMHGRGYDKHGDLRAATFIRREYQRIGLKPIANNYFQPFRINVNTFPGAMNLKINEKILEPGRDYLIDPSSGKCKGRYKPSTITVQSMVQGKADSIIASAKGSVLIIDARASYTLSDNDKSTWNDYRKKLLSENKARLKAIIELTDEKQLFGISSVAYSIPYFRVNASACPDNISTVSINIRNQFLDQYETRNVVGFIKGKVFPDSLLVFTAHYDHLGTMGRTVFFPGANDNASGVSMLLTLADYYKTNPSNYSLLFLTFSAEELGLLGSGYFVDYPLVDLSKIKFLINLDVVGTGSDGIAVVNGAIYHEWFSTLIYINDAEQLLPTIKRRGEACISDHCPFYRRGVPSFFIYTIGGSTAYHDINDRPEFLNFDGFERLTKLLIEFVKRMY